MQPSLILWPKQAVRFLLVGLANTSVGLLVIYGILFFSEAGPATANLVGYLIGMAVSFLLNRVFTFNDARSIREVFPRYILAAGIAYLCNLVVVLSGVHLFNINAYAVQFFGIAIYTLVMFVECKLFVFK
jgi:putative flippase GtrA